MKPPVTLDSLMEMWAQDAIIDDTEPRKEMSRIPLLHAKYLRILSYHNLVVKKIQSDYLKLRKIKTEYYSGKLNNPEDLKEYGYEPFVEIVEKGNMSLWLDADKQLSDILLKKIMHQEIVDATTMIMKELQSRTWQIKGIMDWHKLTEGH